MRTRPTTPAPPPVATSSSAKLFTQPGEMKTAKLPRTFKELCELSATDFVQAQTLFMDFQESIRATPQAMGEFVCQHPIDELAKLAHPHYLYLCAMLMHSAYVPPEFLIASKKYLACPPGFPPIDFLKPEDFAEAMKISDYKTMVVDELEGEYFRVEGYWADTNDELYDAALRLAPTPTQPWDEKSLSTLKSMIKATSFPDSPRHLVYYPIPQPTPWPGQEKFVFLLEVLEVLAYCYPPTRPNILSRIEFMGCADARLPLKYKNEYFRIAGADEFQLTLKNKNNELIPVHWTPALLRYIKQFNVCPSQEFLKIMAYLLRQLQNCLLQELRTQNPSWLMAHHLHFENTPPSDNSFNETIPFIGLTAYSLSFPKKDEEEARLLYLLNSIKKEAQYLDVNAEKKEILDNIVKQFEAIDPHHVEALKKFKREHLTPTLTRDRAHPMKQHIFDMIHSTSFFFPSKSLIARTWVEKFAGALDALIAHATSWGKVMLDIESLPKIAAAPAAAATAPAAPPWVLAMSRR